MVPADEGDEQQVEVGEEGRDFFQHLEQPQLLHNQKHPVKDAPQDKVPAGAVPQAGQEPDCTDIENLVFAVAAQRDVDIVPKKGAERDVPSPPELGDRLCNIGVVEVDDGSGNRTSFPGRWPYPSRRKSRSRAGWRRAARQNHAPATDKPASCPSIYWATSWPCGVGDHHLFGQAHTEFGDALAEILHRDGAVFDLGGHVAVAHNGAGYQLMIAGEIHQVFVVGFLRRGPGRGRRPAHS